MPIINPWIILAILLALAGSAGGGFWYGDSYGTNQQKVADQKEFDRINKMLDDQTKEAAQQYQTDQANIINLMHNQDLWKTKLENEHAQNAKATDNLRREYDTKLLRFRAGANSFVSGNCGGSSQDSEASTSSTGSSTVIQLPDEITRGLRHLAEDADRLKDSYIECYQYSQQIGEYLQ